MIVSVSSRDSTDPSSRYYDSYLSVIYYLRHPRCLFVFFFYSSIFYFILTTHVFQIVYLLEHAVYLARRHGALSLELGLSGPSCLAQVYYLCQNHPGRATLFFVEKSHPILNNQLALFTRAHRRSRDLHRTRVWYSSHRARDGPPTCPCWSRPNRRTNPARTPDKIRLDRLLSPQGQDALSYSSRHVTAKSSATHWGKLLFLLWSDDFSECGDTW